MKRKYTDEGTSEIYQPFPEHLNDPLDNKNEPAFSSACSLQKQDAIQVSIEKQTTQLFQFKHPFCMLVADPSQSGKTSWTVQYRLAG